MSARLVVTFRLDGEAWAVAVGDVAEVIPLRPITRLPGASPVVLGLISWRGRTIPVLSPRPLKGESRSPDVRRRLLVLRRPEHCAILIDEPGRILPAEIRDGESSGRVCVDGLEAALLDPQRIVRSAASGTSASAFDVLGSS